MVLIDDLVDAGDGWITSGVRIAEDCLFFERGRGVPSWIGIEYMAQTIALYSGLQAKRAGEAVRVGFLLGSRRFQAACDYFTLGSYLRVHAREEWQDGRMAVFDCTIEQESCVAKARLNVFSPNDIAEYLDGR